MSSRIFVISSPSGAGKGTVIDRMLELRPELVYSVSATTRKPRAGEIEGVSYYFVTREKFLEMIENGEFLEYAEYVGEFYGTPAKPIFESIKDGKDIILEIDVQGAEQVMAAVPCVTSIFITPPDWDELERRLRKRGTDTEEKLVARMERARIECMEKDHYAYTIINDDVNRAAEEILSIIDSTVC